MQENAGPSDAAARGRALLDLGRASDAERELRQALARYPQDADLTADLGRALVDLRRPTEAVDLARAALALDPRHLGALNVLSAGCAQLRQYPQALDAAREAIRLAPEHGGFRRQEGALLLLLGSPKDALESLTLARRLDPKDAGTVALQASALVALKRFDEAEAAVEEALRLDPEDFKAHSARAMVARWRGRSQDAVEAQRQALRLNPTQPYARDDLAIALKARNPVYARLLRADPARLRRLAALRLVSLYAALTLPLAVGPDDNPLWARLALALLVVVVLVLWALDPLMNVWLVTTAAGRTLLPQRVRRSTYAFSGFVALGLGCVAYGLVTGSLVPMVTALGLVVWGAAAGSVHAVRPTAFRLCAWLLVAGGLLAVVTVGADVAVSGVLNPALVVSGVAMLVVTLSIEVPRALRTPS